MSLTKARKIFEKVQEDALENGDTATEGIAAGLAEMAQGLSSEMKKLEAMLKDLKNRVR